MNPFDILPRNMSRSADAQSMRGTGVAPESTDTESAEMLNFGSLLEGLIDQPSGEDQSAQFSKAAQPSIEDEAPDLLPDESVSDTISSEARNPVFVLLEGLLPRIVPQAEAAHSGINEQSDGTFPSRVLQELQQGQGTSAVLNAPTTMRLRVAVRHQETHFRPVLDSLAPDFDPDSTEVTKGSLDTRDNANLVANSRDKKSEELQKLPRDPALLKPTAELTEKKVFVGAQAADEKTISRSTEKAEGARPSLPKRAHTEHSGLPQAMLQRIARVVGSEVQSLSGDTPLNFMPPSEVPHTVSVKASESALRILNLQLHPADLGGVTIKMRLAGDRLEMELHVEKEETAQLLRNDSEKLSALLRGSGYRPDTISIHVGDAALQDKAAASRQYSDMQMRENFSHQGGASQQDRSRNQEKQHDNSGTRLNKETDEEHSLLHRSLGGVYL